MEQMDVLKHAVDTLERLGIAYYIVGSVASLAYGEARFTQDIDIVAAIMPSDVQQFIAAFLLNDFYWIESAIRDAIRVCYKLHS